MDKLLGFTVGAAKVFLIIGVIVYVLSNISVFQDKISLYTKNSFMYPLFYATGSKIVSLDKAGLKLSDKVQAVVQPKEKNQTQEGE